MTSQEQLQNRINFLETQLESLDHYLPETYQLPMDQLDIQHRDLMELKTQDFYRNQTNEHQDKNSDSRDQAQDQKSRHRN